MRPTSARRSSLAPVLGADRITSPGRRFLAVLLPLMWAMAVAALPRLSLITTPPRVYLMDLAAEHAAPLGLRQCNADAPELHRAVALKRGHGGETDGGDLDGMPVVHDFHKGQHSVEWWLWASLYHSMHRTLEIDSADVVLVHWWCYMRQGPLTKNVSSALAQMWQRVTTSPHYQRNGGAEYMIFNPHPFFGKPFCSQQRGVNPILVVPEERMACGRAGRIILAPYLGLAKPKRATLAPHCTAAAAAAAALAAAPPPPLATAVAGSSSNIRVSASSAAPDPWCTPEALTAHRRSLFLTFSGTCAPQAGKGLRDVLVRELVPLVTAPTAGGAAGGTPTEAVVLRCAHQVATAGSGLSASHTAIMAEMKDSEFCFVLAGDSVSSRRITETMLAGCLPVFVGPPFHNLPMLDYVDYAKFGIFFWHQGRTWKDEGDVFKRGRTPYRGSGKVHNVTSFTAVLSHLRSLRSSPGAVAALQAAMNPYQRFFVSELFLRDLVEPSSLNDALIHKAATLALRAKRRRGRQGK